jgi:hypothetical protein
MSMKCRVTVGAAEKKLFCAISLLFAERPQLLEFLFDSRAPRLNAAPGCGLKTSEVAGDISSNY